VLIGFSNSIARLEQIDGIYKEGTRQEGARDIDVERELRVLKREMAAHLRKFGDDLARLQ
jgi:uncharacterized protein (DUF2237 family)